VGRYDLDRFCLAPLRRNDGTRTKLQANVTMDKASSEYRIEVDKGSDFRTGF